MKMTQREKIEKGETPRTGYVKDSGWSLGDREIFFDITTENRESERGKPTKMDDRGRSLEETIQ